jgi:hypothetical protein
LLQLNRSDEKTAAEVERFASQERNRNVVAGRLATIRKHDATAARALRKSKLKLKRKERGYTKHYLNNKVRKRSAPASSSKQLASRTTLKQPPLNSNTACVVDDGVCASGDKCAMKGVALCGTHRCKSCKKKMHGVLCAGKNVENGPMWCLLCVDARPAPSEDESEDEFGSAFASVVDNLPENLKEKAPARKYGRAISGWLPCPRCSRKDVRPDICCMNPSCGTWLHQDCGYIFDRRNGRAYTYCSNRCSDNHVV